ncbi:hypothetical protein BDZ89DRAFT_1112449 [Hymenopellis radicata]|nr:hypothetical protein BDZ89DRAFT_1112449 [Hymenopellis radicata]
MFDETLEGPPAPTADYAEELWGTGIVLLLSTQSALSGFLYPLWRRAQDAGMHVTREPRVMNIVRHFGGLVVFWGAAIVVGDICDGAEQSPSPTSISDFSVLLYYARTHYSHEQECIQILKLVQSDDSKSTDLLRGYVRQCVRNNLSFNPQFTGLWRDVAADATIPQGTELPPMNVKTGDHIWASFINASVTYAEQTIAEILKVVFKLKNVHRAAGDAGRLAGFKTAINETETNLYLTSYGMTSPWPGSMYIVERDIRTVGNAREVSEG